MTKNRPSGDNFQQLERDFEKYLERQQIEEKEGKPWWIYALALGLVMVSGLLVYRYFWGSTERVNYTDFDSYAQYLQSDEIESKAFSWTYEDYETLDWNTSGISKTTLQDVIKTYGKPAKIESSTLAGERDSIYVTYQAVGEAENTYSSVTLLFVDYDGSFTLNSKTSIGLSGVPYEEEVGEAKHDWKTEDFQSLVVGDSTGKGGVSLKNVLATYGPAHYIWGVAVNNDLTLGVQYLSSSYGDNVTLYFKKDASGDFLLYQKSGTVTD